MNKKLVAIAVIFAFITGLFFMVSCARKEPKPGPTPTRPGKTGESPGETYKIGISLMNRQQSFYKDLEAAFKKAAEKHNVKLEIRNAQQDSAKQLSGVETMLVGDIDAIILCPVDSQAAGSCVAAANRKKVPVFTVDIGSDSGDVVCHIASDNVAGGRKAAEYMAEILDKKGKIVILDSPEVTSVQERVKGFKEVIEKYPDMEIIADIDGGAQKEPAMKAMEDLLQAHEQIDGVFAINDETALGALRAVEAANRTEIAIVGYDATPEARQEILKGGPLKADVVQYPKKMGEMAIETVVKYLKGEEVPDKIPVDVGILDREALQKSEKPAEEKMEEGKTEGEETPAEPEMKEETKEKSEKTPEGKEEGKKEAPEPMEKTDVE